MPMHRSIHTPMHMSIHMPMQVHMSIHIAEHVSIHTPMHMCIDMRVNDTHIRHVKVVISIWGANLTAGLVPTQVCNDLEACIESVTDIGKLNIEKVK